MTTVYNEAKQNIPNDILKIILRYTFEFNNYGWMFDPLFQYINTILPSPIMSQIIKFLQKNTCENYYCCNIFVDTISQDNIDLIINSNNYILQPLSCIKICDLCQGWVCHGCIQIISCNSFIGEVCNDCYNSQFIWCTICFSWNLCDNVLLFENENICFYCYHYVIYEQFKLCNNN